VSGAPDPRPGRYRQDGARAAHARRALQLQGRSNGGRGVRDGFGCCWLASSSATRRCGTAPGAWSTRRTTSLRAHGRRPARRPVRRARPVALAPVPRRIYRSPSMSDSDRQPMTPSIAGSPRPQHGPRTTCSPPACEPDAVAVPDADWHKLTYCSARSRRLPVPDRPTFRGAEATIDITGPDKIARRIRVLHPRLRRSGRRPGQLGQTPRPGRRRPRPHRPGLGRQAPPEPPSRRSPSRPGRRQRPSRELVSQRYPPRHRWQARRALVARPRLSPTPNAATGPTRSSAARGVPGVFGHRWSLLNGCRWTRSAHQNRQR
jgi:hypothetical protein